ncbi:MAG TPA: selenocysteine-specific translation elongation factor [Candidatus Sulfotelmatobacter sp.]|nr:selenocysteine-specific translation elongation factor [Candidatus Sulfotelmatobacter sp.]
MTASPKSIIVGTAGHIDHGKSALVEALTGTHPDRLAEEKRRGITIDLGFAFLEENGVRLGFVDVPGHERFVSNMLAGAAGLDLVLLVIAADESIKPQTREHFEICRLLGVNRGVIALTKSDLVDADTIELARLEIEDYVRDTFLENAPIVPVSAKTRAGLADLKRELHSAATQSTGKDASRPFRLPIDRAFAIRGFGAVVTGTLISGSVGADDQVELFPSRQILRVRGVQSGGKTATRATAGQRTAVNLAGIEHTTLKRGMSLAAPNRFRATKRIDVRLQLLRSAATPLKHRARVHFHANTSETIAEVHLHSTRELPPCESALAHLRLSEEILLLPGDRFIVRQFSPVTTIGGGVVLDALARRPSAKDPGRVAFLETLQRGDHTEILAAMIDRSRTGIAQAEIAARTGWLDVEIQAATQKLVTANRAKNAADPLLLVSAALYEDTRKKIVARVEQFHRANPLAPGITREDLRAGLGRLVRPETFRAALAELAAAKKIDVQGENVKPPGAAIRLDNDEASTKSQIETAFAEAGLTVPAVREVLAKVPVDPKRADQILHLLLRDKVLLRITPELVFHRDALAHLKTRLATYKKDKGDRLTVPAFKDLTGVTRKYAIPLLEFLDRERVTRRAGDERVIL